MNFNRIIYNLYQELRFQTSNNHISPKILNGLINTSQYWDRETLENYQLERINILLKKSLNSKYYSSLYSNYSFPIYSISEFSKFPIISKADFQNNFQDFATEDYLKNGWRGTSSGSTGNPTVFYLSQMAMTYRMAAKERFLGWWGIKPGDRWVSFTGFPRSTKTIKEKLRYRLSQRIDISIFEINDRNLINILRKISEFKPLYFRGYVSAIVAFAKLLELNKTPLGNIRLRCIIVTAEILYDTDRIYIQNIFQCPVVNEYGAAEAGIIALECPKGGMHIQEDGILLRVDDNNEIISTELNNSLMPLINYKVGDKAILSDDKCSCGRGFKLIKSIEGRIGSDEIITPDGRKLNYLFFDGMIKKLGNEQLCQIIKFQIIQEGNTFKCYIVRNINYKSSTEEYIKQYMIKGIGNDINVEFIYSEKLDPERSGKFRIFKRIIN